MRICAGIAIFAGTLAGCGTAAMPRRGFDAVILNGRVMDPETSLDSVRNLGIADGRIAAITDVPLEGRTVLDARGLVVSPGFIDLHAHGQDPATDYAMRVADGVTSALELEVGTADID